MKKSIYYSLVIGLVFQLFACGNEGEKVVHIHQYNEKKQFSQQIEYLDEVISDDDENAHAYFLKAKLYANQSDYYEALIWVKKSIEIEPKFPNYYLLQGELYYKLKDWKRALKATSNAEELGMQQIEMYELLAKIHTELKQTTNAEHYINRISQLDPYNYNLNFLRAINSYHVSDTLYAIRRFQLAIKDELNIEECLQYLAKIHLARKEYDQAISKINQAINKIDQPVELLYLKAKVVEQQGFHDSAYVMLKNAWKYDTLHKELNSELANLSYQQAKFDSSLYYLDKLGKDTSFNIQVLKGDIYFGLRDYPISTEYYQKALLFQKETDYISRQLDRIDWRINYNKKQRAIRDSIASAKQAQATNSVEAPKDSL